MENRYAIVRHDINNGSREPLSLAAPDINQAFGIAAQMDAICNLDGAIDRINYDCHQVTPKFDFQEQIRLDVSTNASGDFEFRNTFGCALDFEADLQDFGYLIGAESLFEDGLP